MFTRPLSKKVYALLLIVISLSFAVRAEQQGVTLTKHGAGTLYVQATLDDFLSTSFLVDTGSGLVTLNKKTFSELAKKGNVTSSGYIAARMANGQIQKLQRFSVGSINIGGNCDLGPVEIAVIPQGANILGINALLKAAPFTISESALTLSGCLVKESV
ncbi:hypothetical protein HHX48_01310 [Salinimonas sp. HHU 13199]|uniref:Aspartyl protease n=1 Tax=Salinimonas profundi TaxID=2729140 RepID=A0ABR8LGD8_9ALTE|nr:aspartyl protease family protein [Salinimonas profundi]MBD3584370.1 hypothetical protein [Salinimonas profundi]